MARSKDYGNFDWDNQPPPAWLIAMLQDMSRWQIIFGGNYFDLPPSSCWLVWDKKNGKTISPTASWLGQTCQRPSAASNGCGMA
jgi:hypothetical protein